MNNYKCFSILQVPPRDFSVLSLSCESAAIAFQIQGWHISRALRKYIIGPSKVVVCDRNMT